MNRSFIRWAALASTAVTLALASASALADLCCYQQSTGFCSCSPAAGTCQSSTAACTGANQSCVISTITYSTCGTTPPAAPSGCSISGAPSTAQAAPYQATLTMNCTAGAPATLWSWTGTGAAGQNTQMVTMTVNNTTTFTATASNAGGTSAAAQATVTISSGGGGGGGGPVVCPGFPTTLSESMAWDGPGGVGVTSLTTYDTGGFSGTGALVVQFTTPAVTGPTKGVASIGLTEFSGPPTLRTGSLSTTPCDFTTGMTGQAGLSSTFAGNPEPKIYFTLGTPSPGYLQLQPSTTYYFNVNNFYNGTNQCSPGPTCDVKITLTKMRGT